MLSGGHEGAMMWNRQIYYKNESQHGPILIKMQASGKKWNYYCTEIQRDSNWEKD